MSAPLSPGKAVVLERVRKSYGPVEVLRDFSLEITAGSFCTLLGASGSGKTTLLKLIAGFETLDGGAIQIGGRDVSHVPVNRRNIGMVFQNYALFPHMSVRDNVAFGLEMRRVPKAEAAPRITEALAMVGLEGLERRAPRELSGGQQQRVALARALVIRPDILLMDEPLGALDKTLRASLQRQIKQLQARLGVTIIFVTHDQEEALHMSDLIVVLEKGRIEQAGTPQELYRRPANRFVASFLGECNILTLDGTPHGIRPEKLRLGAMASTLPHRREGVVSELTFLGPHLRVTADTAEGPLTALTDADHATACRLGERILLGFSGEDAMPLADSPNATP
ncbi:ABC transporter ATP-binding protein [Roseomonas sp. GC11]|uniref:ABC transporter ATP-binding protein n=1 Tax=Roseomonas sp. GC11 TaxID=2950546 RepID=UPI0021091AB9|nr:ABC transporter ATP-binding protein [Roseomonas sp. GC11]MCQ4159333.1 ABC transporter ATP-binding protein [Roseomonas sp. GC11]